MVFELIPDSPECYREWEKLAAQYSVRGKQAHDANLVAAMLAHGIEAILTFNQADFVRYAEIQSSNTLISAVSVEFAFHAVQAAKVNVACGNEVESPEPDDEVDRRANSPQAAMNSPIAANTKTAPSGKPF